MPSMPAMRGDMDPGSGSLDRAISHSLESSGGLVARLEKVLLAVNGPSPAAAAPPFENPTNLMMGISRTCEYLSQAHNLMAHLERSLGIQT